MRTGHANRKISSLVGLGLLMMAAFPGRSARAADPEKPVVVIETSMGDITVELEPERAPKTVANFLKYVDKKFYDDTIFHRVMGPSTDKPGGFMIQGGGLTADMTEKETDEPIRNESLAYNKNGMSNVRGTIAMARKPDPHSATSQFFINLNDENKFLDQMQRAGYTAFGKVTSGMDIVDKIAAVPTGRKAGQDNVPVKTVTIKSIKRKTK